MKEYIIVWRHSHREPFLHYDDHGFLERYSSREQAVQEAEDCKGGDEFMDYQIYETSID